MKISCMHEFLFHWELYCIVLSYHAWKCLYASVHGLHGVMLCIKWNKEYWYSMCNFCVIFFYLLKIIFSKNCSIIKKKGRKLFLQLLLFIRGVLFVCILCVPFIFCICCPLSIHSILLSFFSCLSMDSLCLFDHLYVSMVKLYNFLCPMLIMTKRGRK